MTPVPGMGVPIFHVVNLGLLAVFAGAGLLLLTALWWARAGDGIAIPRDRWPAAARFAAMAGWVLWVGGLFLQVLGQFGMVGVARW